MASARHPTLREPPGRASYRPRGWLSALAAASLGAPGFESTLGKWTAPCWAQSGACKTEPFSEERLDIGVEGVTE